MIDAAAARGQAGTVLVMTGTGFQTPSFDDDPAGHLLPRRSRRSSGPVRTSRARMIAAEALSRT